jgi:hypothetical protein
MTWLIEDYYGLIENALYQKQLTKVMPTDTHKSPRRAWQRSWQKEFTQPRHFNPAEENKTYLEFLQGIVRNFPEIADEKDGDEGEDEDEDEETENDNNNEEDENIERDANNDIYGYNKVKIFMTGAQGDDQALQQDQVEQVAGFCEQATGENKRRVALLDDRNNGRNIDVEHGSSRPYLGPLTVQQLVQELSKPVIRVSSISLAQRSYSLISVSITPRTFLTRMRKSTPRGD